MKQFNKIVIKTKDKEVINFITYTIPNYNKGEYVEIKGELYKIIEVLHYLQVSDDKSHVDTGMEILVKEKGKWF